ncbi:AAA family ATPase [Bradyrhizobium sp. 141]|uniref:AAA family ATPase n=1 Tax=Bradyrhizobium sp. 141 TaxID=2782617 RepID=UPI001FFA50C2|nr:AAA family ATPase [Bradyrhizobium sp. 141]MCK1718894.1 AAA family ATPase [Bradyrhizobium sp. 141]
MTFQFAPAKREQVSLLIALAGASGSGKTYSALRLARGMSPDGKIMFIDTEARRGLHYAEHFKFMHADMRPPFTPARFVEGIQAAEAAGAEVVIIDSFSHEYDGVGGIMDWADRLASEGVKSPGNWKEPKGAHKKLMNALLQCRASIIFCLRADEKIEILRENGKTVVRPLGWMPICEKRFMFEMTASFTLTPDRPGVPHFDLPHKLQQQHRSMFSDRDPIGEDSGRLLAEWAAGGSAAPTTSPGGAADEKTAAEWDLELGEAAKQGNVALVEMWAKVPREHKSTLKAALDRRHKVTAAEADQAKETA